MRGTKSKVKIGNKLTKKTKASLDWDNKKCNKSTIQRIMAATQEEKSKEVELAEPYINNDYVCKTCGNIGKSHPVTSFCFICGDDNWAPVSDEVGR